MENEYTKVMATRTDEELETILTTERGQYKPEALEAAEKEVEKRNVNISKGANSGAGETKKPQTNEDLLQEILIVNKENKKHTEQIVKNVRFFFWLTMISIIGTIIGTIIMAINTPI